MTDHVPKIYFQLPRSCNSLVPNTPSGVYKIQPLPNIEPILVYCEMSTGVIGERNRHFNFLPRSITRRRDAQQIVNALFTDRKNVLIKLQKKDDRSEAYTLIEPHSSFNNVQFGLLVNSHSGYTEPLNSFMRDYLFLGILPASIARQRNLQGFTSNGQLIQFRNCDANPNSLFAFMPNHDLQTPSKYHPNLVYEGRGVAVDWRATAKKITSPDRMMPNDYFFLTELHFGGCGCYTSSDRWSKFGFHASAIGIR
ncbi:uncharacterized protein LOC111347509 [Stylophora pistillata]|uniref:uncharacterized protein LOC111347509 n=1 Tax=Stylophora pistillata TaxID=50429 RepID=UPI000C0477DB|nr:uncharacterized protein LOC111347509 [Stylophora pistillata]